MSYGTLSLEQSEKLRPFLKDQRVYDLGAGDLRLSKTLLHLGAVHVVAVEKEADLRPTLTMRYSEGVGVRVPNVPEEITYLRTTFRDFREQAPLVFVSWPVNWVTGIQQVLAKAETVIYLGKNTDGISCGDSGIWNHLASREVLVHLPESQNTLIVYGRGRVVRRYLPEERVALDHDRIWSFEEHLQEV